MPNLSWIVPCRRAVVRQRVSYQDAANEWKTSLENSSARTKLVGWYQLDSGEYDTALYLLTQFISRFFGPGTQQAVAEPRFDSPVTPCESDEEDETVYDEFCARLWKGPLRVLKEENGTLPPPVLNDYKQAVHRNAEFLPGDVLEFPLAIFLYHAGNSAFQNVVFNPDGSFLLGTATEGDGGGARLHDNLLAMKFQLLLNLAAGVFYHTGAPQGTGFTKNIAGDTISSRGMIFGGTFGNPTRAGRGGWRIVSNHWGFGGPASPPDMSFPYNLPSLASMQSWNSNYILTSGWSCSPTTLFLANYMFDNYADYGDHGVHIMVTRSEPHPLRDRFTEHASSDRNRMIVGQSDMCVFCKSNHEYATVKIKPAENLLQDANLPTQGFLSAYHPLDGSPQTSMAVGEIFLFEATANSLGRWYLPGNRYSAFPPEAFVWESVNSLLTSTSATDRIFRSDLIGWYSSPTSNTATSLGSDNSVTTNLRPIWVRGMDAPVVTNYQQLYADRAVPFPTMQEARNKFPTVSSILPHIRKGQYAVWKVLNGQLVLSAQPNRSYQSLIPPLQPPPSASTTPPTP